MKNITFLVFTISCLLLSCNKTTLQQTQNNPVLTERISEKPTQIFLVRHAEKSKSDPRNPDLSEAGQERAQNLKYHLEEAGITTIYTTDYKRTRQTIQPLADELGITPIIYNGDLVDIVPILKSQTTGNILVVGHSNTTPKLANKLLGQEKYQKLDESVYNKLFILAKSGETFNSTVFQY